MSTARACTVPCLPAVVWVANWHSPLASGLGDHNLGFRSVAGSGLKQPHLFATLVEVARVGSKLSFGAQVSALRSTAVARTALPCSSFWLSPCIFFLGVAISGVPRRGISGPGKGAAYGEKVVVVSASTLMEPRRVCRQDDHCRSCSWLRQPMSLKSLKRSLRNLTPIKAYKKGLMQQRKQARL